MDKKKVMIVDDHPIVRKGIRALLEQENDLLVCGEAESIGEALKVREKALPDVMIVDIALKGGDGLELIKSVRYQDDRVAILVMSMYDESLYAERALRAGANGYIMKEAVDDHIGKAIRGILDGDVYVSEAVRQRILQ
ncbi:MAG: response regulator transcription factor, partial [Verrucomicrobia bacterium]|nr:response regulator transcription factor [Verrucomicrobiota bacterium]